MTFIAGTFKNCCYFLCLAVVGLCGCPGFSLAAVPTSEASLVVEHGLEHKGLRSHSKWAQLLLGRDLCGPGIEPVSPSLAG